jgi:META domain
MRKRWERDLRGLNDVEAPTERIRERSQRAPSGQGPDPMRPPRQRIVAGVVAFAVFIAAGAFAWRALRPNGSTLGGTTAASTSNDRSEGKVVATFKVEEYAGGASAPSASLATLDRTIQGVPVSYRWVSGTATGYFDTTTPEFSDKDFLQVSAGSSLVVDSDAAGVTGSLEADGTYPFKEIRSFGQIADPVVLDEPPGRYILHLTPAWDQGTVEYFFPIELTKAGPASGQTAGIDFVGKNAPLATLTWKGDREEAVRGEYSWCDAGDSCVGGVADFTTYPPVYTFLSIPVGTALGFEGDVVALNGSFLDDSQVKVAGVSLDDPGSVPTTPGRYALVLNVHLSGSDGQSGSATFFFGIEATSTASSGSPSPNELAGSSWHLLSIDGTPVPAGAEPISLDFDADHLVVSVPCRGMGGSYAVNGTSIQVGELAGDQPGCVGEGPADLAREQVVDQAMQAATSFALTDGRLTITSPTNSLVFAPGASP